MSIPYQCIPVTDSLKIDIKSATISAYPVICFSHHGSNCNVLNTSENILLNTEIFLFYKVMSRHPTTTGTP